MANSMTAVVALCLVAQITGFHLLDKATSPPPTTEPPLINTAKVANDTTAQGDADFHSDAVVAPRAERFSNITGKKLKSKFKSSQKEWKPKNNVTKLIIKAPETEKEHEARLFAEFAATWKKKKDNQAVFLSAELDGLDDFIEKINKARDWVEMQKVLDGLGEVGQLTLRQNSELQEDLMVPDKKERQAAAKEFMQQTEKVKDQVLSEKMRLHSEWLRRSHFEMFDAWQTHNDDKARRLQEYDEVVKRRHMRGVPRRPLGDGEELPKPDDDASPEKRPHDL